MLLQLNKLLTGQSYHIEDEGDQPPRVPVSIAKDSIRCFNPRKDNQPGTRITFKDGGGFAVSETYAQVLAYYETGNLPPAVGA